MSGTNSGAIGVTPVAVTPVTGRADRAAFIDLPWRIYADDLHWVPPLKADVAELIGPKNPFWRHAEGQLFLARRHGKVTGRISAHIDHLALAQPAAQGMGPGTGNWGMLEAEDAATAAALIATAEDWLRAMGMTRALGPISLSVWDEPGLLTQGFDHSPTVMMGHARPAYADWVAAAGYAPVKRLQTWDIDIRNDFAPLVQRIIASGIKNPRIRLRRVDKSRFDEEAALILGILNDAWSDNWGFVPLTPEEIAYVGKKLKPIVFEDLIMVAEYDGRPVAFMITLPDLNERLKGLNGRLFPFGWARLLRFLRSPKVRTMRVPLMGVLKEYQSSRLASQLAFMLIETIRHAALAHYGATRGEMGWILDDNQGMNAIAETINGRVNRVYTLYAKAL